MLDHMEEEETQEQGIVWKRRTSNEKSHRGWGTTNNCEEDEDEKRP